MVTARKINAGFTLTEMMVVVVILSILAALSIPLFTHDNNARRGREWAKAVAQLLQRARFQAMGDRADIHVLLYRTRIDMYRKETTGAIPYVLLGSFQGPTADGTQTVAIWDAKVDDTLPTGANLPTGTPAAPTSASTNDIVFTPVGSAVTFSDRTTPANWRVFLRNELLPSIHPDASFVINVTGLTGYISSNDKVTLP
jgi:prepilin-type N-terminal cleavage/methylation domain-containing protein